MTFNRSVFVNCPFDKDYEPILQAIAFCIVDLGYFPRIAPENRDNAANRLERILELISGSRLGIHDISRCQAQRRGEFTRMNMPFELGLDHACARFGSAQQRTKQILILEKTQWQYQRCLSDIAGWDIHPHGLDQTKAVRIVRNWLVAEPDSLQTGAALIQRRYQDFQAWYYERELAAGASEADIREYETIAFVTAMSEWKRANL
jgi:hypothetical protein